jgi:hypothetical protein
MVRNKEEWSMEVHRPPFVIKRVHLPQERPARDIRPEQVLPLDGVRCARINRIQDVGSAERIECHFRERKVDHGVLPHRLGNDYEFSLV